MANLRIAACFYSALNECGDHPDMFMGSAPAGNPLASQVQQRVNSLRPLPRVEPQNDKKRRNASSIEETTAPRKRPRISSESTSREYLEIRGAPMFKMIKHLNVVNQISLVNLTRAYQSSQQGQLRRAPPPLVPPKKLFFMDHVAKRYPHLYDAVQRSRSPEGLRGRAGIQSISRAAFPEAMTRNRSRLCNIVNPEEVDEDPKNFTLGNRPIKRIRRRYRCDQSEAYLRWKAYSRIPFHSGSEGK